MKIIYERSRTLSIVGEDIHISAKEGSASTEYGKVIIRNDNGVFIETEPDKYVNLCEFFKEFQQLKKDFEYFKLHEQFKPPGSNGYHQAKDHFEELCKLQSN